MTKRQTFSLFPLKSVLFPGTVLQLKVFEARYLDLASQCLRENRPFGVVCLAAGKESGRGNVRFESHGVLAHIDTVDAEGANLLKLRCLGVERFTIVGKPAQLLVGGQQRQRGQRFLQRRGVSAGGLVQRLSVRAGNGGDFGHGQRPSAITAQPSGGPTARRARRG